MSRPNIDHSVDIKALSMLRGQKHATYIYEYAYVYINQGGFIDRFLLIRMNILDELPETMSEDEVIDLGAQMCEILSVCHGGETKIYHCDIKPENILMAKDGTYILCDFGASNITQKSNKSSGHAGTPLYEAPEILRFDKFDGRSDIFSLGITMYALLNNGLPPFAKNDNDADAVKIRLEGRQPIPPINGVSSELMSIIRKMCANDAYMRYRNAEECGAALTALMNDHETQIIEKEEARRRAEEEANKRVEEEARRQAEEEARRQAEEEARRQAEEEARRNAAQDNGGMSLGATNMPGTQAAPQSQPAQKRKPYGIIAAAAALVAAIVCGVIWLPGRGGGSGNTPKLPETGAEHFTFAEMGDGYKITAFDGIVNTVVIPSEYNGKPVLSIDEKVFYDNDGLLSVTIPDSITSIGTNSFSFCYNLSSVTIPGSVTSIGRSAFYGCRSMTSVDLPEGIISIDSSAFNSCTGLTSVTLPESLTSIGEEAFSDCDGLAAITVPAGVIQVGTRAFAGCDNLTQINVSPDNSVFSSNDGILMSKDGGMLVQFPSGRAGTYAIPDGITKIGEYAFSNCDKLTFVEIPDSVAAVGEGAFTYCDLLTTVTLPDGITSIEDSTFNYCENLTSVSIPDSVKTIGNRVFNSCDKLISVDIPDSVMGIGEDAFSGCDSLTSVTIPKSVMILNGGTFSDCENLTEINVSPENSVFSSRDGLLLSKDGKTLIQFPTGYLGTYDIPKGITSIGREAFAGSNRLISVTIPEGVVSIDSFAFYSCDKLTSVTIPKSVVSIGDYAFGGGWRTTLTVTAPQEASYYGYKPDSNVKWNVE